MTIDWTKHGRATKLQSSTGKSDRRLAIPVTPELDRIIRMFRDTYPQRTFSDTAIIKSFIEAGIRVWASSVKPKASQPTAPPKLVDDHGNQEE